MRHGHYNCSCVELSEHAESPLRYVGLRHKGDVRPHAHPDESYNGGVPGFLKFAPASNKTIYLITLDAQSYDWYSYFFQGAWTYDRKAYDSTGSCP